MKCGEINVRPLQWFDNSFEYLTGGHRPSRTIVNFRDLFIRGLVSAGGCAAAVIGAKRMAVEEVSSGQSIAMLAGGALLAASILLVPRCEKGSKRNH